MKHHQKKSSRVNILDRARGLVGSGDLVHSFQTGDSTPTFFSEGTRFSNSR